MPRWLLALLVGAAISAALYGAGLPSPLVYLLRGIATHHVYHHGGGYGR